MHMSIIWMCLHSTLMDDVKPLDHGLEESFRWYINNMDKVNKKPFIEFIDSTFC